MVLALASEDSTLWQITLVAGAVVLIVVIALLSLLLSFVGAIESSVHRLKDVAQGVAGNTAHIKIALAVADSLDEVAAEAGRHARLLGVGA
ncbi:MAG: hypothetical protein DLM62_16745 [Pseudonocardiales bacterium]|nr:MAG: hypothetical protein DLM62_16745 [Pseudonocardiales bacterium]